jgi:hypothetical protein
MQQLGIREEDLISGAYMDLIEAKWLFICARKKIKAFKVSQIFIIASTGSDLKVGQLKRVFYMYLLPRVDFSNIFIRGRSLDFSYVGTSMESDK